jgi:hypothetical protein
LEGFKIKAMYGRITLLTEQQASPAITLALASKIHHDISTLIDALASLLALKAHLVECPLQE